MVSPATPGEEVGLIEHARERLIKKKDQTVTLDEVLADFDRWYSRHTGKAVDWD